jgi:hypothetical protein
LGNRFGSVCVSARYTNGPVLWISHFLPLYFITGEAAKEEAKKRLGENVKILKYYYYSPEEQYLEFTSETNTVLIDAVIPGRSVSIDSVTRRSPEPQSEELKLEIQKSWTRITESPSSGTVPRSEISKLVSNTVVAPVGIRIEDASETLIEKKITYWELIPIVDHTPKNWCVPTSKAMVLGFYDNYVKGKGTFLGFGRFIDYWYEMNPGEYNLPNLVDEVIPPNDASKINNYTWI